MSAVPPPGLKNGFFADAGSVFMNAFFSDGGRAEGWPAGLGTEGLLARLRTEGLPAVGGARAGGFAGGA